MLLFRSLRLPGACCFNLCFSILLSISLSLSFSVNAQDMEEVVVEAERQENSTLDVTESIDAFDLEDLETQQIKGFADISNAVPGLTSSPSGAQGLRFTLRGIGARDSQLGVESKVGLYVDGAFLGRASGLVFDIVDLERVEVLKGPQGFTFGRNAIGGVINLITAKADVEEMYGRLELKAGNFGRKNVTGLINVPISDSLAFRAAAFKNIQDGWVKNNGLGEDWSGYDREGLRVSGRWIASESIIIDYTYDEADFVTNPVFYQPQIREGFSEFDRRNYGDAVSNIAIQQPVGDINNFQGPQEVFGTPLGGRRLDEGNATLRPIDNSTTEADGHTLALEWAWSDSHTFNFVGTHRTTNVNNTFYLLPNVISQENFSTAVLSGAGRPAIIGALEGENFLSGQYDGGTPTFENLNVISLARARGTPADLDYANKLEQLLDISANAAPGAIFTQPGIFPDVAGETIFFELITLVQPGISAPYRLRNQFNSLFSSPQGGLAALKDHKQWSLEFKQSGFFLDDRLSYVGGVYYFNERTGNGQQLPEGELYTDVLEILDFGRSVGSGGNAAPEDSFGFSLVSLNRLNTEHIGIYFNTDYTPLILDERLHLSVGMRYSQDKRDLVRRSLQAITLLPRGAVDRESDTWESFDPRIKVGYDVSEDIIGYISVTSGNRPGNFNVEARNIPQLFTEDAAFGSDIKFEEESQISYEFGFKGSMFNGLMTFEYATFYSDVKDGQETVVFPRSPISRSIVNANGFAYGAELDTTWSLTDELTLVANYALLRSGSDTYVTPFVFDAGRPLNVSAPAPANGLDDIEIYNRLILDCQGALRRVDVENGRCVERKNNFGAPVNSWQVALDYRLPTNFGEIFVHLGYSFKEAFFVNDALKVDARNLWDLRLQSQFDLDAGVMRVALWSQNLFDNEYQTQKFELNQIAYDLAAYGTPRTFGIDVIYEWH